LKEGTTDSVGNHAQATGINTEQDAKLMGLGLRVGQDAVGKAEQFSPPAGNTRSQPTQSQGCKRADFTSEA
jgi:hypothetical protein